MTTDLREKIAEVLAGHRLKGDLVCACGLPTTTTFVTMQAEHERHVAEAILAAIGEPREERRHRALSRSPRCSPCAGPDLRCTVPEHHQARTVITSAWLPVDTEDPRRAITEGQGDD